MENVTWNRMAAEIHKNAIAHGWWETERDIAEICALIHSELSEALEEYRNGREMYYYFCNDGDSAPCTRSKCKHWEPLQWKCLIKKRDEKPEGIAVELADAIIRILDYAAKSGIDIEKRFDSFLWSIAEEKTNGKELPYLVAECHKCISEVYDCATIESDLLTGFIEYNFAKCISLICEWCAANSVNIVDIIYIKHEYNKTRSYKHGGKRC